MAKKTETEMKTTPVRIDSGIVRQAKIAAEHQRVDLATYLSDLLKGPVERDWAKARKAIIEA
jgi:hypothetical protein